MKSKRIGRREAIGVMGAAGAALAFGCGDSPTSPTATPATTTGTSSACAVTPFETAGPYPSLTDLFRSDIREGKTGTLLKYGTRSAQTFLRGIQTTNSGGEVTFTTIYPGWCQGRATDFHIEGMINGRSVKVTQIAFPESVNAAVYASGAYASRGRNPVSNASDNIFADSLSSELVTPTGNPTN